jgi:heterodisulfide reductase subunit A-like polyferredoxin
LVNACPAGAINPDDGERVEERQVGAMVLAIGAELFDP